MVYGCGAKTVKCLVLFFNFLAFLSGAVIFSVSLAAYFNNDVDKYLEKVLTKAGMDTSGIQDFHVILIVSAVIGGVIFLAGFAGCCGALTESACMLSVFSILMVILIVVQLSLGIATFAFQGKVETWLDKAINETAKSAETGDKDACGFFQEMATKGICCGITGKDKMLSPSCVLDCKTPGTGMGCGEQLWASLWANIKWAGLALLIMLILELAATVFACCLCSAVRKGQNLYEYV